MSVLLFCQPSSLERSAFRGYFCYNVGMDIVLIVPILLGLLGGFLVNYLADVLPDDLKITQPTCKNTACQARLVWTNYILLRRCPECQKAPSIRAVLVIVLSIAVTLYLWIIPPTLIGTWYGFFVFEYLLLVALIDLEHRLVLRPVSLVGLVLCLLAGLHMRTWQETLIGAAAGFAIMFFFYLLGVLFSRIRRKRLATSQDDGEEALGSGDVTLALILGLLLGWPLIWFDLLFGILLAGLVSFLLILGLVVTRKYRSMMVFIAYGPYFIIMAFILLFFPSFIKTFLPAA